MDKKNKLILAGSMFGSLVIGTGASLGIALPIVSKKAKDSLGNFLPFEGESLKSTWADKDKKLNVVALGDSQTNGYINGYEDMHNFSYADVFANDLKNIGKLNSYQNLSHSGDEIYDLQRLFTQVEGYKKSVEKADVILVTIGGNDLTDFVTMLGSPFSGNPATWLNQENSVGNTINPRMVDNFGQGIDQMWNDEEYRNRFEKSIANFTGVYSSGKFENFFGLEEGTYDNFINGIKRKTATFIRDLRYFAPNAQIIYSAPIFPFPHLLESDLNSSNFSFKGKSIIGFWNDVINSIEKGVTYALDANQNKYVDFYDFADLTIHKTSASLVDSNYDDDKTKFSDYIKLFDNQMNELKTLSDNNDSIPFTLRSLLDNTDYLKFNAYANTGDIHPSSFGYEILGNALFHNYGQTLGLANDADIVDNYTFTVSPTEALPEDHFLRVDETSQGIKDSVLLLALVNNPHYGSIAKALGNVFNAENQEDIKDLAIKQLAPLQNDEFNGVFFDNLDKSKNGILEDVIKYSVYDQMKKMGFINEERKTIKSRLLNSLSIDRVNVGTQENPIMAVKNLSTFNTIDATFDIAASSFGPFGELQQIVQFLKIHLQNDKTDQETIDAMSSFIDNSPNKFINIFNELISLVKNIRGITI